MLRHNASRIPLGKLLTNGECLRLVYMIFGCGPIAFSRNRPGSGILDYGSDIVINFNSTIHHTDWNRPDVKNVVC